MTLSAIATFGRKFPPLPLFFLALILSCATNSLGMAQDDVPGVLPGDRSYSPYPEQNFPNQVLFGDTRGQSFTPPIVLPAA